MENFTIADVARIHNIKEIDSKGPDVYCVCPFCGDTRGKFSYTVKKGDKENIFGCYACGEGGKAIKLHMLLTPDKDYSGPDGYKKAAKDIFKALKGDIHYESRHREFEKKIANKVEEPRKPDEEISKVYQALLGLLTLSEPHKKELLTRGLSENQIREYKFKTFPYNKEKEICAALIKKGLCLEGIPGFYLDDDDKWTIKHLSGYMCPVYDFDRKLIVGFQIRMDKALERKEPDTRYTIITPSGEHVPLEKKSEEEKENKKFGKYIWLSSSGLNKGCSSGARSTYLKAESDRGITLITEGILKATITYALLNKQVSVIGIPGVNSYTGIEPFLKEGEVYFEALDMDKYVHKEDVELLKLYQANPPANKKDAKKHFKPIFSAENISSYATKLRNLVAEKGMGILPLVWDSEEGFWLGHYKGIDDYITAYPDKDRIIHDLERRALKFRNVNNFLN